MKSNSCYQSHQLIKEEANHMILTIDAEKAFDKINTHS
jgi:hypothetical protein